ncbi:cytochrome P450 [Mycena capillaripes]|nr:cytochrome P450 [Mycena capillaripes]
MKSALALPLSLVSIGFLYVLRRWLQRRSLRSPPGPPKDPFIGHLRHMPAASSEFVFHEWAKTYGDVIQLEVFGQSIIVLDTQKAASDLLDKRSSKYSDRPEFPLYDILGWTEVLGFARYGKRFATHRQVHKSYLNRQKCADFVPMQTREVGRLVRNLLASAPEKYIHQYSRYTTGILAQFIAGHQIDSDDDPYMDLAKMVYEVFARTGPPRGTVIDFLPVLQYFPNWFPGTYYAGVARALRPAVRRLFDYPVESVQKQREAGECSPSFVLSSLEEIENNTSALDHEELKAAAATMFSAGEATTWSSLTFFVLAMVIHPEYQRMAQEELDSVIGKSRLPTFGDRKNLPFIECVLQETLRYVTCLPHRSTEDDVYRGMYIPKGSLVFANIRGMSLDESVYKDAQYFRPERFLPLPRGNGEPHFASVFGFGRRICTGVHLADTSLWLAIASILATCTISKALDEHGNEIVPEIVLCEGLSSHPNDFPCIITPRSAAVNALLVENSDAL